MSKPVTEKDISEAEENVFTVAEIEASKDSHERYRSRRGRISFRRQARIQWRIVICMALWLLANSLWSQAGINSSRKAVEVQSHELCAVAAVRAASDRSVYQKMIDDIRIIRKNHPNDKVDLQVFRDLIDGLAARRDESNPMRDTICKDN